MSSSRRERRVASSHNSPATTATNNTAIISRRNTNNTTGVMAKTDNGTAVAREQHRTHRNQEERKRSGKLRRAWEKRRRGAMQRSMRETVGLTGRRERNDFGGLWFYGEEETIGLGFCFIKPTDKKKGIIGVYLPKQTDNIKRQKPDFDFLFGPNTARLNAQNLNIK